MNLNPILRRIAFAGACVWLGIGASEWRNKGLEDAQRPYQLSVVNSNFHVQFNFTSNGWNRAGKYGYSDLTQTLADHIVDIEDTLAHPAYKTESFQMFYAYQLLKVFGRECPSLIFPERNLPPVDRYHLQETLLVKTSGN